MMACTPSSLRTVSVPEQEETRGTVTLPNITPSDLSVADMTIPTLPDSLPFMLSDSLPTVAMQAADSLAKKDSVVISDRSLLTTLDNMKAAAAKVKRDTTTMDSLELAIYKHNKAVDDSLALDSINRSRKSGIDSPVEYSANDSLTYEASVYQARLYGESNVKYQNMDLASEKIFMRLDSNLVHAEGRLDSTTQETIGSPVFKMGSDEYQTGPMSFNFKTKKGLIKDAYTQQDDGFLTSEVSKRGPDGEMYLQHGRYTTCDDPHPDFYLALSRAKVRPGKDVVFGPAYLVVADVPLPLAVQA